MNVLNGSPRPSESDTSAADFWMFFRKFVKHGTKIASVAPSSRYLCRMMCKGIDYNKAQCIVELGAGTGPITQELLSNIKPHTRLVIVERDPDFCRRLRARFPTADIVEGDAAKLDELLADRDITRVDHVVSGLPLPSFSPESRRAVLAAAAKCLGGHGTYRQLTVTPWVYWSLYRQYFSDVKFKLEVRNLPPAGVYLCHGYKPEDAPAAAPAP